MKNGIDTTLPIVKVFAVFHIEVEGSNDGKYRFESPCAIMKSSYLRSEPYGVRDVGTSRMFVDGEVAPRFLKAL